MFSYFSDWSKFYGKMLDSLESSRGFCTILFSASTSSSRLPWTGPSPSAPGHRLLSRPDVSVTWKPTQKSMMKCYNDHTLLSWPDSSSPENQYRNPWWNATVSTSCSLNSTRHFCRQKPTQKSTMKRYAETPVFNVSMLLCRIIHGPVLLVSTPSHPPGSSSVRNYVHMTIQPFSSK